MGDPEEIHDCEGDTGDEESVLPAAPKAKAKSKAKSKSAAAGHEASALPEAPTTKAKSKAKSKSNAAGNEGSALPAAPKAKAKAKSKAKSKPDDASNLIASDLGSGVVPDVDNHGVNHGGDGHAAEGCGSVDNSSRSTHTTSVAETTPPSEI
jgi:hypothetical protein